MRVAEEGSCRAYKDGAAQLCLNSIAPTARGGDRRDAAGPIKAKSPLLTNSENKKLQRQLNSRSKRLYSNGVIAENTE